MRLPRFISFMVSYSHHLFSHDLCHPIATRITAAKDESRQPRFVQHFKASKSLSENLGTNKNQRSRTNSFQQMGCQNQILTYSCCRPPAGYSPRIKAGNSAALRLRSLDYRGEERELDFFINIHIPRRASGLNAKSKVESDRNRLAHFWFFSFDCLDSLQSAWS